MRRELAQKYSVPGGFKRIYFYHIRKCAGTSLTQAFLGLTGQNGRDLLQRYWRSKNSGWHVVDDFVFVHQNKYLIERGDYYYAESHSACHEIRLPPRTFTITLLRDPVARVISHYRMLLHYEKHNQGRIHLRAEGGWLGNSISDFLTRIPDKHLLRQLYMFSKTYDVEEAVERIMGLGNIMFVETYDRDLAELSARLSLDLKVYHAKSKYDRVEIEEKERDRLREMVRPEYLMIRLIKERLGKPGHNA